MVNENEKLLRLIKVLIKIWQYFKKKLKKMNYDAICWKFTKRGGFEVAKSRIYKEDVNRLNKQPKTGLIWH